MKLLIAAACVVIIVAGGWYGWTEWQDAQAEKLAEAQQQEVDERAERFRSAERNRECEARVAAWDRGERARLADEFGDYAEKVVDNCRYLLAIPAD